jgi:putative aminopeptidase FrvX
MHKTIELMKRLSEASGVSGYEDAVVAIAKASFAINIEVVEDTMRNLVARSSHFDPDKPTIIIDGHSDEVGFIVQTIEPNGMIKVLPVGGWVASNVMAHRFRILGDDGEEVIAISASKPPHFMTDEERTKTISLDDMRLDVGASDAETVRTHYKISEGAPVVPDVNFIHDSATGVWIGKAFDNRIGCALVIEIMNELDHESLNVNVVGVISTQEEVGTRGAEVMAQVVEAAVAIVLEGTPADDMFRERSQAQGALGKGAQIRFFDRSMISHPRLTRYLRDLAISEQISMQSAVRKGGGTNAGKYHLTGKGVPSCVLGVPVRYAHTHYGICKAEDYKAVKQLLMKALNDMTKEMIGGL